MSGALSTKGKEGRTSERDRRRDADYQVDLGRDPGNIPHTHARRQGRGRAGEELSGGGGAFLRCIDIHWGRRRGNQLLR